MKIQSAVVLAISLAAHSLAYPEYAKRARTLQVRQSDPHPFIAPGPTDLRAPCPGTNTIANHGFINRDGRNITTQALQQGYLDAYGFAFDVTDAGAQNAITLCGSLTGATCTSFNLDMLDTPHAIEHDASLSRDDKNTTFNQNNNNFSFNQTIWDLTLAFWGSATHLDVSLANSARLGRVSQSQQEDTPGWFQENDGGSETEHAFLLTTFDDPTNTDPSNPQARIDWINHLVVNEELPTSLGWVRPTSTIVVSYLNQIITSVASASTVPPPSSTTAPPSKRDVGALNDLLANPSSSASVRSAASAASAAAGPAPTQVNAYRDVRQADEWTSHLHDTAAYVDKVVDRLNALLGS